MNIHLLWQTKVMELPLGIPLLEGAVGAYTSEEFERTPDSSMMEQTRAVNVSITEVQLIFGLEVACAFFQVEDGCFIISMTVST